MISWGGAYKFTVCVKLKDRHAELSRFLVFFRSEIFPFAGCKGFFIYFVTATLQLEKDISEKTFRGTLSKG